MDVKVPTFVTPHLFWILDTENLTLLHQLNNDLQRLWKYSAQDHFEMDEIVAVQVDNSYYRAVLKSIGETNDQKKYMCWLLDYGTMIDTGKLCKLPTNVQNMPPIAVQASLNKVGFLITQLTYNDEGAPVIIHNKSHLSSPVTRSTATSLIENANTLVFHVEDKINGIVVGDLLYEKDETMLSLRQTLYEQKMLIEDEALFTQIINNIQQYKEEHLMQIHQICRRRKIWPFNSAVKIYSEDEIVETEIDETTRKNLSYSNRKSTTNESESEFNSVSSSESTKNCKTEENQRRSLNLQMFYNKNKTLKNDDNLTEDQNNTSDTNSDHKSAIRREKLLAMLKKRAGPKIEETPLKPLPLKPSLSTNLPKNAVITAGGTRNIPIKNSCGSKKSSGKRSHCQNLNKFDSVSESESLKSDKNTQPKRKYENGGQITPAGARIRMKTKEENNFQSATSDTEANDGSFKPCIMQLGPQCPCKSCNHWTKEADFKIGTEYNKKTTKTTKLLGDCKAPPFLRAANSPINKIISMNYGQLSRIEKMKTPKMLIHGSTIPIPIHKVADAAFHTDIHETLNDLNYVETKRTQTYVWPSIFRQQHTCLINRSNTGKTMAYLPVMCSFILEKSDYYRDFPRTGGPIVVILCRNSTKCETVYDLIWRLLKKSKSNKISVVLVTNPLNHINTSNVDILITVPGALLVVLASKAVNLKRLCHFVVDDADVILKNHDIIMNKLFNLIDNMLENRISSTKKVQLIMCGEHWSKKIEDICKNLHENIFICIPNQLEAALYGGMEFKVRFQDSSCKEMTLRNLIKDRYHMYRTVIFCTESELEQLDTVLMLEGIEKVVIGQDLDKEDMLSSEELWKADMPGKFRVLVTTDYVFSTELPITNAMILIHYSLPLTWTNFTKRFTCFLENIKSPLVERDNVQIECHVLIDESAETLIKKFFEYLKECLILPEICKDYYENIVRECEQEKITHGISLCPKLKLFGKCASERCSARHTVDHDLDIKNVDLPKNGTIKFKIVEILDVTHFTVKLISHTDLNGNRIDFQLDNNNSVTENLTQFMKDNGKNPLKKLPISSHRYAYFNEDDGNFYRCVILSYQVEKVKIHLLDVGSTKTINKENLYRLPHEFQSIMPSDIVGCILFKFDNKNIVQLLRILFCTEIINYMNKKI